MKRLFCLMLTIALITTIKISANAQDLNIPPASPTEKISQQFGFSKIEIAYSRPGVKERTIFGGLVPFDAVWRTGANTSTKISFGDDVKLEGHDVPAGKYALYTIPGKDQWTIIISKDTTLWGAFGYKQENDFLRFTVKPMNLPMSIEDFTIDINNIKPGACDITLLWEKTMVTFHATTEVDSKIMAQIDVAMKGDKKPYVRAATYYYENNKDMKQALEWVNTALEAKPDDYETMTLKAKIQAKLNDNAGAVATSQKALELAKAQSDGGFIYQNEKLQADLKSKK